MTIFMVHANKVSLKLISAWLGFIAVHLKFQNIYLVK